MGAECPKDPAAAVVKLFSKLDQEDKDTLSWLLVASRDAGVRCAYVSPDHAP
jgi:hypothetical protein